MPLKRYESWFNQKEVEQQDELICPKCGGLALVSKEGGYVCLDCVEYFVEDSVLKNKVL